MSKIGKWRPHLCCHGGARDESPKASLEILQPGVQRVLTGADAYVAPARLESFGLAALEARCAGVPVVAMAASGVTEFVRHDVEGLLAADDADAARLLHVLATDPERRERIRRHNVDTDPQVTWPQVLAETLRQYAAAGAPVDVTV